MSKGRAEGRKGSSGTETDRPTERVDGRGDAVIYGRPQHTSTMPTDLELYGSQPAEEPDERLLYTYFAHYRASKRLADSLSRRDSGRRLDLFSSSA